MAKVAVDADGVLCRFIKGFIEEANHIWPGRIPKDYIQQNWDDIGGLSSKEIHQVWERIKATPNWWMKLDAYSSNVAALMIFLYSSKGHDVYIVTSRVPTVGATVAFQTDVWLRACGVEPHANYLAVLAVEGWEDKRHIYQAAQFDFSIDDKGETVLDCEQIPNHKAYLLDQPWNTGFVVANRVKFMQDYFHAVDPRI